MRLDKFLKVSRLIKRRTVAKEVCDAGRVTINERHAKSGSEVKAGDIILIGFGNRSLQVRILSTPETVKAQDAATLYEVLGEDRINQQDL